MKYGDTDISPAYFDTKFIGLDTKYLSFDDENKVKDRHFETLQNQPFNCTQLS